MKCFFYFSQIIGEKINQTILQTTACNTKDCPDASDELDCEVADESQTRNPTFKNARTFPLANTQNSLTAPR